MTKITVHRRPYTRSDGTRVKGATFTTPDKGKRGRTPKSGRWFSPSVHTGWSKDLPAAERRKLVLRTHKGDLLASGRAMQALSNVSTDRRTKQLSGQDARYFYAQHRKKRGK